MFTGYPWYPRGKVVKVGVCVTKLRHLEQICCQMLMITQQSWLYLIKISMSLGYQFWQGKKGQSIFSLLCFHEALELVEVSNSILAILFKSWLWSCKSKYEITFNCKKTTFDSKMKICSKKIVKKSFKSNLFLLPSIFWKYVRGPTLELYFPTIYELKLWEKHKSGQWAFTF